MVSHGRFRIAIFHLGFFYSGGGEKLIIEEMRGLRALGHEVECFAPYVDRANCFPDIPEMSQVHALLPAPPKWLPMKDPIWVMMTCLLMPALAPRFRRFDILVGANQPGPWLAFVAAKLLGKPYVAYLAQALRVLHPRMVDLENGIRIREGDTRFINALTRVAGRFIDWADRISIRKAAAVLTNGQHVGRWISDVYGVENIVCPAGCHPVSESELRYKNRWEGALLRERAEIRKPYILLTNRHSPMKRFEYAIWAMKSLQRLAPEVDLVITGQETEYTDQLRYLVKGLGLDHAVKFVGLVSEAELKQLYLEAALYVYPSPEEDFGMGVVEAMAAGTPVVAWKNGGPTVTVQDLVTGFLVTPYDTDLFTERIVQLLNSPALAERMGRAGHQRAQNHFSYRAHNLLIAEVLSEAIQHRKQALPDPLSRSGVSVRPAEVEGRIVSKIVEDA